MQHFLIFFSVFFILFTQTAISQEKISPVSGKIICLDAGHGGTAKTDSFRDLYVAAECHQNRAGRMRQNRKKKGFRNFMFPWNKFFT